MITYYRVEGPDKHGDFRTTTTDSNGITVQKITSKDEGLKADAGKPRMDLLSPIALIELAKVLDYGSKKYGDNNWRKGLLWSRVLAAALRHLMAYIGGEDKDPETGLSHLAHVAACIMFLLEYEVTHKDKDDRYKQPIKVETKKEGE